MAGKTPAPTKAPGGKDRVDSSPTGPIEHDPTACVVASDLLNRVGDKWSVLAITLLGERTYRFTELHRAIDGISQRMLSLTLRQLERDGLVHREAFAEVPPRVEYSLTPLGHSVLGPLTALADWARSHGEEVAAARQAYDASNSES